MAEANLQIRGPGGTTPAEATAASLTAESFTVTGETSSPSRLGTFGNPTVIPVMTRQGYQDQIVTFLSVEKVLFATPPEPHGEIVRTQTGQTYFVQAVNNKDPVVYTYTLTDRQPYA